MKYYSHILLMIFLWLSSYAGSSASYLHKPTFGSILYNSYPQTYEDFYLERASYVTQLDEVVLYTIQTCRIEGVDPLEMIAILQVENPLHDPSAVNINYRTKIIKKKKVKYEDSRDIGVFQLNSKAIESDFTWFYWEKRGETEEFDPYNFQHNIRVAVRLHKANRKQFKDLQLAVYAYNSGPGSVTRNEVKERTINEYWPKFETVYKKMKEK